MDGLEEIKIGIGYDLNDKKIDIFPFSARDVEQCIPIYETMPGWQEKTMGIKEYDQLPENAKAYLNRLAELCGAPIAIISTGPDREETIILKHPLAN